MTEENDVASFHISLFFFFARKHTIFEATKEVHFISTESKHPNEPLKSPDSSFPSSSISLSLPIQRRRRRRNLQVLFFPLCIFFCDWGFISLKSILQIWSTFDSDFSLGADSSIRVSVGVVTFD